MKTSSTHSASSISLMLHVLVQFANAPQNNSNDSWCHCLRFKKLLYLSKKTIWRFIENDVQELPKTFKSDGRNFHPKVFLCKHLFPLLPVAKNKSGSSQSVNLFRHFIDPLFFGGFVYFHSVRVTCLSTDSFYLMLTSCC